MRHGTTELKNSVVALRKYTEQDIPLMHKKLGSRRVLEKAGFTATHTLEAAINADGMQYDRMFFEKRA